MANTFLKESPCKQTTESAGQNLKQIFSLLQEKVAIQAGLGFRPKGRAMDIWEELENFNILRSILFE